MTFIVQTKTVSEANLSEHHMVKARRVKGQRTAVVVDGSAMGRVVSSRPKPPRKTLVWRWLSPPALPATVTLTRIAPRALDGDNLQRALKAVRDQVAELIGVDDRDPLVEWEYAQRKGDPKQYAVLVEITPRVP